MGRTSIVRTVDASSDLFGTAADTGRFSEVIPEIVRVVFLTGQRIGVGTQFRETHLTRGKESSTDLKGTEYAARRRLRLAADSRSTGKDTVFVVAESGGRMDATPYSPLPGLLNPPTRNAIRAAIEKDMDGVQAYCEGEKGG